MRQTLGIRLSTALARALPEQRLFLRSDSDTRFIRLSPLTQFTAISGGALILGWTVIASAILILDTVGAGGERAQAAREQALYEDRLNAMATERDSRAEEAARAHDRFSVALAEVSAMQTRLLESEERRRELETGIEVIQATLRDAMEERDTARAEIDALTAELTATAKAQPEKHRMEEMETTVDFLARQVEDLAEQREEMEQVTADAKLLLDDMIFEAELQDERQERIFTQIEDAVATSLVPLDEMFAATGLPTDSILDQVRRTYTGQGGPLTPITFSTSGTETIDPLTSRANEVLSGLDELNLYRIAAEKLPFSIPVKSAFRYTSGFGPRWGRMHNGTDFAGAHGTPIYSTADGVVTKARRLSGYGNVVYVQHDFGVETRYAHLSKIRVTEGQRVSRGQRIGDMGNTGRSTGTHLHYEVRVGSKPVNPMTYIKAARDVF